MVGRTSIVENDRSQTPTVTASSTSTNWRKWVLANKRASKYETVKRTTPITQITPTSLTSPAVPVTSPAVPVASPAPVTPTTPLITQPDISQPKEPDMVIAVGNVQFKMMPVKGGIFTMGAIPEQGSDASSEEKPAHNVKLDDYYIAETEVTQELWETVMGDNPSHFKGGTLPVETVSWEDCQQFIKKLNELTGMSFRLPTEAEWEYAARGGNQSKGYKYSGSDKIKNVAWFDGNSAKLTHNVKTKKPNELGIYDMSGNVWEWCQDWYKASYDTVLQTNPQGPNSGTFRARRGGGWYYNARDCRVSNRANHTPSYRSFTLGLRLALSPQI
jgi:formylglycine-generating enzyme required for sulfatase activity